LLGQTVLVRGDDTLVRVCLGPKEVAQHARSWDIAQDVEDRAHRIAAFETKPRPASALPAQLIELGQLGADYFRIFAATHRSVQREIERLSFLCEVFGVQPTALAIDEVMRTGHVGAEYIEYVLRHRKGLHPQPAPIVLGNPELDGIHFVDPDLSIYDEHVPPRLTLDPSPKDKKTEPEPET
jgi:hypothetical protein